MPNMSVECPECGRMCGNGTGLASHLRSMHPEVSRAEAMRVGRAANEAVASSPTAPPPPPSGNAGEMIWEAPPHLGRRATVVDDMRPLVVKLAERPGSWARMRTWATKSGAGGVRKMLIAAFPDCDVRAARFGASSSAVWMRTKVDAGE